MDPRIPPTPDDADKTIIRPMPGGRRRHTPAPPGQPEETRFSTPPQYDFAKGVTPGANPLIDAALPLLGLVSKLRSLAFHANVDELHDRLAAAMREFQQKIAPQGFTPEQIKIAGYFLCSLIDETVLSTPWGSASQWSHSSMLILFHKETWGGEKFFDIVQHLSQQPAQNLALLELAYLCLSLGFEGKYRIANTGPRALEQLRQELYLLITRFRGEAERGLSIRWRGLRNIRNPILNFVPLWVVVVVAASLLTLTFVGLVYAINRASDQVYAQLAAMARREVKPPPVRPLPAAPVAQPREDRWRRLLAEEIAQHKVEVIDGNLLRVRNSFPAGSAQITRDFLPMLEKIARELQNDTTRIKVIGHTDNVPIFTARFPSNWHLSQARAQNVADYLTSIVAFGPRLSFEGIGDSEPLVANDTPENRAINRRIEIRLN